MLAQGLLNHAVFRYSCLCTQTSSATELGALNSVAELFKLLEKDDSNRNFLVSCFAEKVLSTESDKSLINAGYSVSYYYHE